MVGPSQRKSELGGNKQKKLKNVKERAIFLGSSSEITTLYSKTQKRSDDETSGLPNEYGFGRNPPLVKH